jgi:hypothetical protein
MVTKGKLILVHDTLAITQFDLLRALSWLDFVGELNEEDKRCRDNILKIINFITRND